MMTFSPLFKNRKFKLAVLTLIGIHCVSACAVPTTLDEPTVNVQNPIPCVGERVVLRGENMPGRIFLGLSHRDETGTKLEMIKLADVQADWYGNWDYEFTLNENMGIGESGKPFIVKSGESIQLEIKLSDPRAIAQWLRQNIFVCGTEKAANQP